MSESVHPHMVALFLPEDVSRTIDGAVERVLAANLGETDPDRMKFMSVPDALERLSGKPLREQRRHITLAMASVGEPDEIKNALASVDLEQLPPLRLTFSSLIHFGPGTMETLGAYERPLVMLDIEPDEALVQWQHAVRESLVDAGIDVPQQYFESFVPHISLALVGRGKTVPSKDEFDAFKAALQAEHVPLPWTFTPESLVVQSQRNGELGLVGEFEDAGPEAQNQSVFVRAGAVPVRASDVDVPRAFPLVGLPRTAPIPQRQNVEKESGPPTVELPVVNLPDTRCSSGEAPQIEM
jgi:2'-5' RNA ligase